MATVALPKCESPWDDDEHYEVINGHRVKTPRMGTYETLIASIINHVLGSFARTNRLGRVVVEMLFLIEAATGLKRRPDLAFVSYDRWPRNRRPGPNDAWDVVPDLAVEVISPTNRADEVQEKILDYFRTGVRLVWVIYPNQRQVYVYDAPTRIRVLQDGDELDGADVIPGFRMPLKALFDEEAE